MGVEPTLKPAGLFTDPNPISAVPPGALREALNVVIRRDGIVEPRVGFKKTPLVDGTSTPDTADVARLIPWKTSVLTYDATGEATFHLTEFGGTAQNAPYQLTGAVGTDFVARAVEARENLYVCATDGVRKYTDVTDDVPALAGINGRGSVMGIALTGASGFLANGSAVIYRAVIKRRDENATVVTSSPCAPYSINNASGGTRNVGVAVYFGDEAAEFDEIEVYRSLAATTPADETFFAYRQVVTSTDVTNGYISFTDSLLEADLGADLYTNASQEGINQANDPPPKFADVALFRGSLFGANVTGRRSAILRFQTAGTTGIDQTGNATGVGYRGFTGTTTITSPTITAVPSTAGIVIGQRISMAGFTATARVIAVVANTSITVNQNASATAAGIAGTAYDTITVGGYIYRAESAVALAYDMNIANSFANAAEPFRASLINVTNVASGNDQAEVLIEDATVGSSSTVFYMSGTQTTAYSPALSPFGASSAADESFVDANLTPNGLLYSKQDQPEAMPYPANLIRVGSSSHAIERIVPTKDALWIFKRDGIFRLTGSGAPNWRVDPFDMTHYLIAVDSAVVMDDAIFAWTNRGVVRISDAGITQISALAIGSDLREAELYGMAQSNAGTPFGSPASSVFAGGWAIANVKDDEYIFAMLSTLTVGEGVSYTVQPYVYNTKTQAWTRWTMRHPITSGAIAGDGKIVFGGEDDANDGCLSVERSPLTAADGAVNADWNHDGVGSGVTTLDYFPTDDPEVYTMQLSDAWLDWYPAVGDVLYFDDNPGTVTAVADAQNFTVYIVDAVTADMNEADIREAISCSVLFVAKIDGRPGTEKAWQGGTVEWGSTNFVERYATVFFSSLLALPVSTTQRADEWPDNTLIDVPSSARFWVPRNHSRSGTLYPGITIAQADAPWQIYGITLANVATYQRVRR